MLIGIIHQLSIYHLSLLYTFALGSFCPLAATFSASFLFSLNLQTRDLLKTIITPGLRRVAIHPIAFISLFRAVKVQAQRS